MADNLATNEFPYQLVTFLGQPPAPGTAVYHGSGGWWPHITLKRRFGLKSLTESELLEMLKSLTQATTPFKLQLGRVARRHLPVDVIEVCNQAPKAFHQRTVGHLGYKIKSRYPDREGSNYYPHMTVEWNGQPVVDANQFVETVWDITKIWLLKDDVTADDSRVLTNFLLTGHKKPVAL